MTGEDRMDKQVMTEKMLSEFQEAFSKKFGHSVQEVISSGGKDAEALVGGAMWAWKASREAVEVELPSVEGNGTLTRGVVIGVLGAVRSSIESQGLKVKS